MTSTLEDMQAGFLDSACMATLGDTIGYKPAGGSAYIDRLAYVDHTDSQRSLDGSMAIEQDITVQALKTDIPVKPSAACRVTLPKHPGKVFKPVNVGNDASGNYWNFELVAVNA